MFTQRDYELQVQSVQGVTVHVSCTNTDDGEGEDGEAERDETEDEFAVGVKGVYS